MVARRCHYCYCCFVDVVVMVVMVALVGDIDVVLIDRNVCAFCISSRGGTLGRVDISSYSQWRTGMVV